MLSVQECLPWVQTLAPPLQLALIVLGWVWIAKDNDKRERRKEVRALIVELKTHLIELEENARKYFTNEPDATASLLASQIKRDLRRVDSNLEVLRRASGGIIAHAEMIEVRQAITLRGDFDGAARKAIQPTHELLGDIGASINKLCAKLEDEFTLKYGPRPKK